MQARLIRVEHSCLLQECFRATWIWPENRHRRLAVLRGAAFTIKAWHLNCCRGFIRQAVCQLKWGILYNLSLRCWYPLLDTGILLAISWLLCLWAVPHLHLHSDSEGCFTSLLYVNDSPTRKTETSDSFSFGKPKSYSAVSSIVSFLHSRALSTGWDSPLSKTHLLLVKWLVRQREYWMQTHLTVVSKLLTKAPKCPAITGNNMALAQTSPDLWMFFEPLLLDPFLICCHYLSSSYLSPRALQGFACQLNQSQPRGSPGAHTTSCLQVSFIQLW